MNDKEREIYELVKKYACIYLPTILNAITDGIKEENIKLKDRIVNSIYPKRCEDCFQIIDPNQDKSKKYNIYICRDCWDKREKN